LDKVYKNEKNKNIYWCICFYLYIHIKFSFVKNNN
jgi:hypothetical protein